MKRTKLKEWLQERQISQSDFAVNLGITRQYLGFIANGGSCSKKLAEAICTITSGDVPIMSLLYPEDD